MPMAEGPLWQFEVITEGNYMRRLLRYLHAKEAQWTRKGLEDPGNLENLDDP